MHSNAFALNSRIEMLQSYNICRSFATKRDPSMARTRLSETAGKDVRAYIETHLGCTLRYQTIDRLCGTTASNEVYTKIVGPLIKDGVLTPQNTKLIRGNDDCPIYLEYRICDKLPEDLTHSGVFMVGTANAGMLSTELATLSSKLTDNGYLALNLKATLAWIDELRRLSDWLDEPENVFAEPALPEERSFEIFRNEKLLNPKGENREGRTLLEIVRDCGVYDRLRIFELSGSELPYYVPRGRMGTLNVLIVENHVPFVRICDLLDRGERKLFGKRVDGVVYGSGFAVLADGALENTQRLLARGHNVRYLYWGDIDRPGIEVFERLAETRPVELLVPAYEAMLDAAVADDLPHSGGQKLPPHMGVALASQLDGERLETYLRVMAADLRVPQEAVPVDGYVLQRERIRIRMPFRAAEVEEAPVDMVETTEGDVDAAE